MTLNEAMKQYAHSDKERFPSCGDDEARPSTLFWADFSVADVYGKSAILDTYKRCGEWKDNAKYWTELVIVLNHKIWYYYENGDEDLARLYDKLWKEADQYACDNFKGDDAKHYFSVTD